MSINYSSARSIVKAAMQVAVAENKRLDALRSLFRCKNWGEGQSVEAPVGGDGDGSVSDLLTESGALYAFVDTMAASIVPTNPQVTVEANNPANVAAAGFHEALINYGLRRDNAHDVLWRLAIRAGVYPYAPVKAVWDMDTRRPKFVVIDPRHFMFDRSANRWEDVRWCCQVRVLTREDIVGMVKKDLIDGGTAAQLNFGSYPEWLKDKQSGNVELSDKVRKEFQWVTVYEFFDFTTPAGGYFMLSPDLEQPIMSDMLPYVFVRNPFHLLSFNDNLEDIGGMSDAEIIEAPVHRRDELLTLELRFVQSTIPVSLMDSNKVDNPESAVTKMAQATGPWDIVPLDIKDGRVSDVFGHTQTPSLNPAFKDINNSIDREIMFRLGMPEYSRGGAGASEVATEIALQDAALQTRQGRRVRRINDVIRFMASSIVGFYEEYMTADETLPIRLGKGEYLRIARKHLEMRDPSTAEEMMQQGLMPEPPLDLDYVVAPYSPVESNKNNKLRKIDRYKDVLFGNPRVDQKKLLQFVFENLDMEDITINPPPPPQGMPGEQPGSGDGLPPAGGGPSELPAQGIGAEASFESGLINGRDVPRQHPTMPEGASGGPGVNGQ